MSVWTKKNFSRLILSVIALGICLLIAVPAQGHGYIVRSSPEARSVIPRAPKQVQIWFSEGLAPDISTIAVFNQSGEQVDLGDGGLDPDNPAKLQVSLPSGLPNGAYLVRMRPVFTGDGHAVNDTLVFWVGEQVGNIDAEGASSRAQTLEAVWRAILSLSLSILFGAYWMYAFILRPTWGNSKWALGHLPPRIMSRLSMLVWSSLIIAWLTNLFSLIQITMALFEADLGNIIQNELWNITLAGTAFGDAWGYRMGLLTAILFIQIVAVQQARNRPHSTHVLWLVNGGLTLLTLGTLSLISHAAGASFWRIPSTFVDYAHLSSVAAWVGGLIIFALILHPALAPLNPSERYTALKVVLGRFSRWATFLIALIIMTGIYSSFISIPSPTDLPSTTYGLTLIAKWILILPVFILGALHYLTLNPTRFSQFAGNLTHLLQTLRLEAIFVLGVMFAAAWLPATPPPQPDLVQQVIEAQTLQVEDYEINLAISPGALGSNTYDIAVIQAGAPLELDSAKIRFFDPEFGRYTAPLQLDEIELGEWGGASGDIYRATTWNVLVDIYPSDTPPIRAAFEWEFVEDAAKGRQPSLLNWLAVLGLFGVLIGASALYINWTPTYLTAAGVTLLGTILIGVSVAWFIQDNSRRLEERRNPHPEVVNSIFPDQSSVQVGAQIYANECASCHDLPENPNLDPIERNEADLWRILSRGMVNKHFFGNDLSDEERWNLINFLRQREGSTSNE